MNIVKLRNSDLQVLTDMPIQFLSEGKFVVIVAFTGAMHIFDIKDLFYICPLDKYTGQ